jgi:hypothetical protein
MSNDNSLPLDAPQRLKARDVAARYQVSERLAGEWIRAAVAAGTVRKMRRLVIGRWSQLDAWVAAGGTAPISKRRRGA